jgi:hypothetical protein
MGLPEAKLKDAMTYMLKDSALLHYYSREHLTYQEMIQSLRETYEGPTYIEQLTQQWHAINYKSIRTENPTKNASECIDLLVDRLLTVSHSLPPSMNSPAQMYARLLDSTRGCKETEIVLANPPAGTQTLVHALKTCVTAFTDNAKAHDTYSMHGQDSANVHLTDRRYNSNAHAHKQGGRGQSYRRGSGGRGRYSGNRWHDSGRDGGDKSCFICGKTNCWSTRHTREEREKARNRAQQYVAQYVMYGDNESTDESTGDDAGDATQGVTHLLGDLDIDESH